MSDAAPRSAVWSGAAGTCYGLAWLVRGVAWVTGSDHDRLGWTVVIGAFAAGAVIGALGWAYWRLREFHAAGGTVGGAARPWLAPLAGIAAFGVVVWAAAALV